jgi:hypothetical protein
MFLGEMDGMAGARWLIHDDGAQGCGPVGGWGFGAGTYEHMR